MPNPALVLAECSIPPQGTINYYQTLMLMDYSKFQPVENMGEVTHIFKKIFDGGKTFGTDSCKMGFYNDSPMVAKVDGNTIEFALPFNGAISLLREFLTSTHYNKTNSIIVDIDVNDDNTMLTATFYTTELKLFAEF